MMVGKKLFKTKLCLLYERGRCGRQSCSFAHGDAELRRHTGSFYARRDNRESELRGKFDRRHSTLHRYSPVPDTRAGQFLHARSPLRSFERRRKKHHVDAQSDLSENLRVSNAKEGDKKDGRIIPYPSNFEEQLKHIQLDIDQLVDNKSKLQIELEETALETESLSSRIQDLELQLSEEKEYCKRITSKVKKFVKEQNNYTRLQDEMKRSQVRLNKLVKEVSIDAIEIGESQEDPSIHVVIDGETTSNHMLDQVMERREQRSFMNQKLHINLDGDDGSKSEHLAKKGHLCVDKTLSWRGTEDTISNAGLEDELVKKRKDMDRHSKERHPKRHRDASVSQGSLNKGKGSFEPNRVVLPSTSMAAHAIDDLETEDRAAVMVRTDPSVVEEEAAARLGHNFEVPLPPLPTFSQNNYSEYKGGDEEKVDVDGVAAEEEQVEVD